MVTTGLTLRWYDNYTLWFNMLEWLIGNGSVLGVGVFCNKDHTKLMLCVSWIIYRLTSMPEKNLL